MALEKGICGECGKPMSDRGGFGYHPWCATDVHAREEERANRLYPYVVVNGIGAELERFDNEAEATDYLHDVQQARLENRTPSESDRSGNPAAR